MKCNTKTMVTTALALGLVIALGYWALPQLRGAIAPFTGGLHAGVSAFDAAHDAGNKVQYRQARRAE